MSLELMGRGVDKRGKSDDVNILVPIHVCVRVCACVCVCVFRFLCVWLRSWQWMRGRWRERYGSYLSIIIIACDKKSQA